MPMSQAFADRLLPVLPRVIGHFGTPFHIYDEAGIVESGQALKAAFAGIEGFNEFFAVKANPNPSLLATIKNLGFGFDCSSIPELKLARQAGAKPDEIIFTSNNTSAEEFAEATTDGGCILNLDDITLVPKVPVPFPELICFRYNPGPRRTGNTIIGQPETAKYGVSHDQIVEAYRLAQERGAKRFGLHTMVISNELDFTYMVGTVRMLLDVVRLVSKELAIRFKFINMGGGLGIPYKPGDIAIPINKLGQEIKILLAQFNTEQGYVPSLFMESGRWVAGPHGVLVSRCINEKHTYREFRGLDANCISTMMRPAMYHPKGGYHEISVFAGKGGKLTTLSVVGSACEDNDRFGWDRELALQEGDIVLVHDTGAHCYAMANNYNGRLRPPELMLGTDGTVRLIRRAETVQDLFATLDFEPNILPVNNQNNG